MKTGFVLTVAGASALLYGLLLSCAMRYDLRGEIMAAAPLVLFLALMEDPYTMPSTPFRDRYAVMGILMTLTVICTPILQWLTVHYPFGGPIEWALTHLIVTCYVLGTGFLFTGITLLLSYEDPRDSLKIALA